ncbi:MAG: 2,3-bisphosphoglycerate-independent phosphoglycerate mutase [Candidatus Moranbacteria bacterium CG10_big_fil_rev_8_21_14_0_10_35_21]|nr:MAG: 2,3-bisphosphoglycerate-independent phosphoglycerate mutase [Candidatus Moranbacteria bacterium CG10_big_fil_rev_8_21_14_0_10_35_21]PJA88851.1 MAG: 2,3-bisphosphoglycerate-independent phosphoglycerate mutase [Candidatus Moranbacteria bacterium CG_4_9_14_3_um_filter_36_9]
MMSKPVVLVVLDGWGLGKNIKGNAITSANPPTIKKMDASYPHCALQASGISVGLNWGEVGNSEVGHMTLGAGKIIYQNMPRITMSIQSGEFYQNKIFLEAMANAKKNNSSLHLMGLVGNGGVHSYIDHLYALLEMAKKEQVEKVYIHAFTDGRDSSPNAGAELLQKVTKKAQQTGVGKIASVCGRYFGMDRNNNWDRTQKAYNLLTQGKGETITSPADYLRASYKKEIFDEHIEPAVVTENGKPVAIIQENDSLIFFNFREDRARQITQAFMAPDFSGFKREPIKNLYFVAMVQYEENLKTNVAFPPVKITESLGSILSDNHKKQLRIAETEKFAHVTYFFNGGDEKTFPGEERVIIPSAATDVFDKVPEMKAREITDKVIELAGKNDYDFILINYANADMVGHTGNEEATIEAVKSVDHALENLIPFILSKGGCLLITADHGNAEELKNNLTGEKDTEHSLNPVPIWFISPENHSDTPRAEESSDPAGLLSDIAPTILELLEIKKPEGMTGESLLEILK